MFRPTLILFLLVPAAASIASAQQADRPAAIDIPNGQAIFLLRCAKCHGSRGEGVNAPITIAGPNIQAEHNAGDVMMAMEVGPSHMPKFPYLLSISEMNAVADYVANDLAVIPLSGGNLGEGGRLFRIYCAACHRTAARGGALGYVGVNAPDLTNKSAALIAGAIRWGPGPMPSFPASVINEEQLVSIVQYVRFVQHPPSPGGSPLHWYGPVAEGFVAWVVVFMVIGVTGWIERGGKG